MNYGSSKIPRQACRRQEGIQGTGEGNLKSSHFVSCFSLVILIAQLKKRVVERALAGELTHHLGYAKGEAPDEIDSHRTE